MQIEGVTEIGEGPHFIHIFTDGVQSPILEVNLHHELIESITVFETSNEPKAPVLDASGTPVESTPELVNQEAM
jgi:hypothetical protein